jgi:hypothetical protein
MNTRLDDPPLVFPSVEPPPRSNMGFHIFAGISVMIVLLSALIGLVGIIVVYLLFN